MPITLGNNKISNVYVGNGKVSSGYLGNSQIYSSKKYLKEGTIIYPGSTVPTPKIKVSLSQVEDGFTNLKNGIKIYFKPFTTVFESGLIIKTKKMVKLSTLKFPDPFGIVSEVPLSKLQLGESFGADC